MDKRKLTSHFEISGSILAMIYALLIASNTGNEIIGFTLPLISASLFAAWAVAFPRFNIHIMLRLIPRSAF